MKKVLILLALATLAVPMFANIYEEQCTNYGLAISTGNGSNTAVCAAVSLPTGATLNSIQLVFAVDFVFGNGAATAANPNSFTTTWSGSVMSNFGGTQTIVDSGNASDPVDSVVGTYLGTTYTLPGPYAFDGTLLGFLDPTTSTNSALLAGFSITQSSSGGSAVSNNPAVGVIFNYTPASTGTPEPVSMLLLGSGLLGISLVGRKFARK